MRVGEIAETVMVSGESPIVDVQNTTQQRVLSHEIIDAIPTGRSDKNLATLIPGVSIAGAISQDVGGTQDQVSSQLIVHGTAAPISASPEWCLARHNGQRRQHAHRRDEPQRVSGGHDRHRCRIGRAAHRRRAGQLHPEGRW